MKKYKPRILMIIILIILIGFSFDQEEINQENIVEATEEIEDTILDETQNSYEYLIEDNVKVKIERRTYSIGNNTLSIEIPKLEDNQYTYMSFYINNLNYYIEKYINNLADIYKLINYDVEDDTINIEISNYEVVFNRENIVSLKFLYKKDNVESLKAITFDLKYGRILNLFNIVSVKELDDIIENNEFEIIDSNYNENDIKEGLQEVFINNSLKNNFFLENDGLYIILSQNSIIKILNEDKIKEGIERINTYIDNRFSTDILERVYNDNSHFLTSNIWIEEVKYTIDNNKITSSFPIIINGSNKLNSLIKKTIYNLIGFDEIEDSYNTISDHKISNFNLFFEDEERLNFTFSLHYYYERTAHPTTVFYELIIDLKNEDVELIELGLLRDLSAEDYKKIFGETDYYRERYGVDK